MVIENSKEPIQPVILMGASNLARAFPLVVNGLRAGLREPLAVLAAFGHGRSYGLWSQMLGRTLPGIAECGLWAALRKHGPDSLPPLAAVIDIGNDLVYGVTVPQLLAWVDACLDRLAQQRGEIALMSLPLASIERLPPWKFELLRRTYFPMHEIAWPVLYDRVSRFQDEMRLLAKAYGIGLIEPPAAWYGFDPIHMLRRRQPDVWRELFSEWPVWDRSAPIAYPSLRESVRLRALRPAERYVFGYRQTTPQPVLKQDRFTLSMY
ncbi:hypothetical protein [Methylocaldum sp.]|uniref:hypothetical protein n=1 Tax=Methylocaldum sp. TaxID=1969727 RepID=UPI002D6988BD|nr:hypothetical protein [Methylocaldum sp.]HYE36893.1 hypothetical protein [Methylocaldum sp.]